MKAAVGALEKVLVRVAASVVSKDLQAAAALSDVGGIYYERGEGAAWVSEARNATPWIMDCSQVRRLARQELTRRGLSSDKPISPTTERQECLWKNINTRSVIGWRNYARHAARNGARGGLAQQTRSSFARELPAMRRKHRIQKRQNADGLPRLN